MKIISDYNYIFPSNYILYIFIESIDISIDYIFPNYNDISIWILIINRKVRLKEAKFYNNIHDHRSYYRSCYRSNDYSLLLNLILRYLLWNGQKEDCLFECLNNTIDI